MKDSLTPIDILQAVYGYSEFRGLQEQVITEVLEGKDVMVLMPTGGGKSLCYQLPAIIKDGVGLVISPLIALMEDQVLTLKQLGVKAAFLNSTLEWDEVKEIELALANKDIDLLYLAPERINQERTLNLLRKANISLIAIDEAHCVSQWGHNFRPDYLAVGEFTEHFPGVPRMALTATADTPTRKDIHERLCLREPKEFISSFDRSNIQYQIELKKSPIKQLIKVIKAQDKGSSGIVYCLSRKKVEQTAEQLSKEGFRAIPYHAGMSNKLRESNQRTFILEEGVIMVATVAFGMGIDKPNVRFVAHLDLPNSLESYYQETGRAGRDSLSALAWMCYGLSDIAQRRQMIGSSESDQDRKTIEHRKLGQLLGYVETTKCRREVLLNYFGEKFTGPCNNCDTCLQKVDTWDGSVAAQKALSAMLRTGERFGTNYLIEILLGQSNDRIKSFRHDQIKTFGVGKDLSKTEWMSVYRQLVAAGAIEVDVEGYGSLSCTEYGSKLLKGEETISFRRDVLKSPQSHKHSTRVQQLKVERVDLDQNEKDLFEVLREKRLTIAKEQSIPPYVIFHDKTLAAMAKDKPGCLDQMKEISGVGESKLEKYGDVFLKEILDWANPK